MEQGKKILIYTAAALAGGSLMAGVNAAGQAARKSLMKVAFPLPTTGNGTADLYGSQYPVYFKKITGEEAGTQQWNQADGSFWQLPVDPVVTVSGKNIIARRNVSKTSDKNYRGSVKELWSRDDYSISISGVFLGSSAKDDLKEMNGLVNYGRVVAIYCPLFEGLDIYSMVIESFTFSEPSEGLYKWSLQCLSDDSYELLTEN